MIRDLLKGKIRLVVTYWVFIVLVGLIYKVIGIIIENYYLKIIQIPHIKWLIYLYLLFPFIYFPIIYVATWRSCNNYTKNKLWPTLAKIAMCLGTALLIYNAYVIVQQVVLRKDINYEINSGVQLINKSLPIKINNALFTHVSFENNIIFNDFKYPNIDKSGINIDTFARQIKPVLIKLVCSNSAHKRYQSKGVSIAYRYYDQHDTLIYEYTVKPGACP